MKKITLLKGEPYDARALLNEVNYALGEAIVNTTWAIKNAPDPEAFDDDLELFWDLKIRITHILYPVKG